MADTTDNVDSTNQNLGSNNANQETDADKRLDVSEVIFTDIGGTFGKYQIINYILFCLPFALSGSFGLSYVFTALNIDHR